MKIAITSTGNSNDSPIDPRFGRCAFFAVYDTENQKIDFLTNPAKSAMEGAGPAAVQFIAKHKVKKVISGDVGMKIKSLFDTLRIDVQIEKNHQKTINSIIQEL